MSLKILKRLTKNYLKYGFFICLITLFIVLLGYLLIEHTKIERYTAITLTILLWILLQYILIRFKNKIV